MRFSISRIVLIAWFIFLVSCGKDESEIIPTKWEGQEVDFQKDFTTQKDGNETLILHQKSKEPLEGKIERNGTAYSTVQNFEEGKLNGKSVKKSKDGSWVEANYKNGKLNGDLIFFSKEGKKRSVLKYRNGVLIK
jgi:antitoxin component YwqK of YwqJK toxin-antitoxin module